MTDNVTTSVGSFATDEIGGFHWQRVKVTFGPDGTATDVSASNRLPVDTGLTLPTTLGAKTAALSLSITPATDAGLALDATIVAMSGKLPASLGAKTAANSFSITPASDATFPVSSTALTQIATSTAAAAPATAAGALTTGVDSGTLTAKAIWVGGAGNVVATIGGVDVTFTNVPAGTLLPIQATKIKAASTATGMVWLG